MDIESFLLKFVKSRERLSRAIQQIKINEDLNLPINAKWTISQHLAHILWYEEQMITMLQNKDMSANREIWQKPIHERNQVVHRIQQRLTTKEILKLNESVPRKLQQLIEALETPMLSNSSWITHMPPEWKPWEVIASNTFDHFNSHLEQFKAHCAYLM